MKNEDAKYILKINSTNLSKIFPEVEYYAFNNLQASDTLISRIMSEYESQGWNKEELHFAIYQLI